MRLFTSGIYFGLVFITREAIWLYTVIFTILDAIWKSLVLVCYGLVNFVVVLTSQLTSAVDYITSPLLTNALLALNGPLHARVSRFSTSPTPVIRSNWNSPLCAVVVIIATLILTWLVWQLYKSQKVENLASANHAT